MNPKSVQAKNKHETVVLLHGYAAGRWVMWPLSWWLKWRGYDTAIWSYWSLSLPIAVHGARFAQYLKKLEDAGLSYSIVAHSMGSIITRVALMQGSFGGLRRVVLLAPPNRGLPIARLAPQILKRFSPPLRELSDASDSYVNSLPEVTRKSTNGSDIGVIAAKYDLIIPIANTRLDGSETYTALPASHNSLLISITAAKCVESFLASGRFC
jgi:triacylglycerol esterase/lipase EstA (alpha/beta hydrolase family)